MKISRPLRRLIGQARLGGVCAGIAHYFDLDVTLVRLATVLLVLVGGLGSLAYFIAWAVIPDERY